MAMTTTSRPSVPVDSALLWKATHQAFVIMFGLGALVHVGFGLSTPLTYAPFADAALFDWVRDGWQNIFMVHPTLWALLLGAGELTIAGLLVLARRVGYAGVIAFHLALMLFGWGFFLWCVPALGFAVPAAVHEFRRPRQTR
jgi:hypothetical protein